MDVSLFPDWSECDGSRSSVIAAGQLRSLAFLGAFVAAGTYGVVRMAQPPAELLSQVDGGSAHGIVGQLSMVPKDGMAAFAALVLLIITCVWATVLLERRRGALLRMYAQRRGLSYEPETMWGWPAVAISNLGVNRGIEHEVAGRIGAMRARLFYVWANTPGQGDSSGDSWRLWAAHAHLPGADLPAVACRRRKASTRLDDLSGRRPYRSRIETGDDAFDDRYVADVPVRGEDEALGLLDERVRSAAMQLDRQLEWQVCGDDVVVYTNGARISEQELDALARGLSDLVRGIEASSCMDPAWRRAGSAT